MPRLRRPILAVSLFCLLLVGCSGTPAVSGSVTFDGQPVDGGVITFTAQEGGKRVNAEILGGKYRFALADAPAPGLNRVEILWSRKTGKQVPVPGDPGNTTEQTLQVLPARFNTSSELKAEVKSGSNTFDYATTSH